MTLPARKLSSARRLNLSKGCFRQFFYSVPAAETRLPKVWRMRRNSKSQVDRSPHPSQGRVPSATGHTNPAASDHLAMTSQLWTLT